MNLNRFITSVALTLALAAGPAATSAADVASPSKAVAEAKQLLDTYYGNQDQLRRAGNLLASALQANDRDADAYIQSARLVVNGGYISGDQFRTNTAETYHVLVDKALALDPSNPKARLLKAEAFHIQRNYQAEKIELDMAKALGASDTWYWFAYARYLEALGDYAGALEHYQRVEAMGPGKTHEQRRAFISALGQLGRYAVRNGDPSRLRALAAAASRERDPGDAWTLHGFADDFMYRGLFDEAIEYARSALRVMSFGAGRRTLAASLYCRAAQLTKLGGQQALVDRLIEEARSMGFTRNEILGLVHQAPEEIADLIPTLERLVK